VAEDKCTPDTFVWLQGFYFYFGGGVFMRFMGVVQNRWFRYHQVHPFKGTQTLMVPGQWISLQTEIPHFGCSTRYTQNSELGHREQVRWHSLIESIQVAPGPTFWRDSKFEEENLIFLL
jgi:hypothetical protein